jgi:hypothetical protein
MSKKKKLWGVPATIVGLTLGLVAGVITVVKGATEQKFPTIGIIITIALPILAFAFEQVMHIAFPEAYWQKVAGKVLGFYRYLVNESFRMRFIYELRFPLETSPNLNTINSDTICKALNAEPGGDPEPISIGENFIHLRFSTIPFSVALKWSVEEPDEGVDDGDVAETVFVVTMEPEIRDFVFRNAQNDMEALLSRLQELQQNLTNHFKGLRPTILVTADAWFGSSFPPATSIPYIRKDGITRAEYRLYPGRLHVAGTSTAILGAVCRYVKVLEPPPDADNVVP